MLRHRTRQIIQSGPCAAFVFALAGTAVIGCTEASSGTEGETSATPTTEPTTGEPDDDTTTGDAPETTDDPDTTTVAEETDATDDTTDPTNDTSDTSEGRVLGCDDPNATMVWDGDIYIDEPSDVDLLAGHFRIDGDVRIFNQVIDNIDALSCITEVNGSIQVFDTALTDLAGLANITVLEGSLSISENPNLMYVHGFNGIETLDGALIVTKNDSLTGVYGFEGLTEIVLGINIDENAVMTEVPALDNLVVLGSENSSTMPGNYPDLSIAYNPELVSIRGPVGLAALGGQLVIQANPKLCISQVQSLAEMLQEWIQEGEGDTSGNKNDC